MRKRKREDTAINCYKFHCWFKEPPPPAEDGRKLTLPPAVYETAKMQQKLWNDLSANSKARWDRWKEEHPGVRMQDWKASEPEDYALYWKEAEAKQKELVQASKLNWEVGPDTLDRFRAACKRLGKGGGSPRPQFRLESFSILHRYTGGGVPLKRLTGERNRRFRIIFPHSEAYRTNARDHRRERLTSAWFSVGDQCIGLNVIVHREIAPEAIVKKVALTGHKQSPVMPWRFWLVVTVEEPKPSGRGITNRPRVLGLDVGWRKLGKESRIAVTWDGEKHDELRLPLAFSKQDLGDVSIDRITALSTIRDQLLESCKTRVSAQVPEHARVRNQEAWRRTRNGGLVRFLSELQRDGNGASEAAKVLQVWKRDNDQLLRQQLLLENAFNKRREWLYRNFASKLAANYDVVGIEGLDLAEMSARENIKGEENRGLRRSAQRRKYAAVSELFAAIQNAMEKCGGRVIKVPPRGTTHTCAVCGKAFDTGIAGKLGVCPQGHEADRDENASKNIYSQTYADLERKNRLRNSEGPGTVKAAAIQ